PLALDYALLEVEARRRRIAGRPAATARLDRHADGLLRMLEHNKNTNVPGRARTAVRARRPTAPKPSPERPARRRKPAVRCGSGPRGQADPRGPGLHPPGCADAWSAPGG